MGSAGVEGLGFRVWGVGFKAWGKSGRTKIPELLLPVAHFVPLTPIDPQKHASCIHCMLPSKSALA